MSSSIKFFIGLFCALYILACAPSTDTKQISSDITKDQQNEKINRSTELIPEPDITERLIAQKMQADSKLSSDEWTTEILVKLVDKEALISIEKDSLPADVETTYNIWRDSYGAVKVIGEYPFSRSGDWNIGYIHYFDASEKTFAFMRVTGFFNSGCSEDIASEEIIDYFDKDFNRVDRKYTLTDGHGKVLDKADCVFPYDYPYEISKDVSSYSKEKMNSFR